MYAMECIIAKTLDGKRDLAAVSKAVMPSVPWATLEQVEKVVTQIAGMGLLSNVQNPRLSGAIRAIPSPLSAPTAPIALAVQPPPAVQPVARVRPRPPVPTHVSQPNLEHESESEFEEQTKVGGVLTGNEPIEEKLAPPPPAHDNSRASEIDMDAWGEEVPPNDEVDMDAWGEEVPPNDEVDMDAWGEEVPPNDDEDEEDFDSIIDRAAPPQASTAVGGAETWDKEKVPFYRGKWFQRTLKVSIVLGVILILGLIPYPIYVTEKCVVQPTVRADIRSQIEGVLVEVLVDEGELVEKGQILAKLDARDLTYELTRAKTDVERLSANLGKMRTGSRPEEIRQAKARVGAAQQDLTIASKQHKRAFGLYRNKVGSKSDVDDAKGEMQVRSRAVQEAKASLRLVQAGFRLEEVKVAEAQLRQAEAEVVHLTQKIELLVLRAPISGHVLTPKFRERLHEKIELGEKVVEIGNAARVRIEVSVLEEDADIVALGQPMEVKVHSYPLRRFKGKVTFIAPTIEERDGRRYVRVDAEFDNADGLLLPRMTGYGEIYTGDSTILNRLSRRFVRWIRVRFLI
tara:strand:+ start:210581 stop:212293 length:1713 start_codon:yes stop_codon:yes gene_type:complete